MLILVLGSTGFLGGHIAREGFARGWSVRGFRREPGARGNIPDLPIEWIDGDLMDTTSLAAAMAGVDIVFHAAGYYPKSQDKLAVEEHLARARHEIGNVVQAAQRAGIRRLVYTSSLTTIGQPPRGETRLADERDVYIPGSLPQNAYYEVKIAMESAVSDVARQDPPVVILNPTLVLGPGDIHNSSTRFLQPLLRYRMPFYLPVTINLVDVRDMAAAHLAAAERGRAGERYILGGHNLTLRAALTQIAEIAGVRPPGIKLPLGLLQSLLGLAGVIPRVRISDHLKAISKWQGYNITKAARELDLMPRPADETIQDTLRWIKFRRVLPSSQMEDSEQPTTHTSI